MQADIVIVGAGSAGCLLANRLSADSRRQVLLIEAGGEDDWIWIKIPVGYLFAIANPRTDWCFKTEPDPGLNGRSIHYARGRVIGGSSSINAMIYMRGQASDYDRWVQATGDDRWGWPEALATYRSMEDYFGGASPWHGVGGEMRVESPRVRWEILDAWRQAAAEQGIAPIEEFNRGDNSGCAYFHVTQRRGIRWSMADAFLHPVRHRPNLKVITKSQVLRLITAPITAETAQQRRYSESAWANAAHEVVGLEILCEGSKQRISVRDQVILSAGAVSSPHLLQASGVGPAAVLSAVGVPIVHDLAGVGENLQDHLQIRTVYQVTNCATVNTLYRNPLTRIGMALQYAFLRSGPMTMPPSTLGAFAKSRPDCATPDLEWHVQPLSLPKFGEPLHRFNAITPSVCNLRPSSRGFIRLTHPDPMASPKIMCNYLSTEEDLQTAVAGLRWTRQIMQSQALASYRPTEILPGSSIQTEADLMNAARDLGTTIFHPVATCAMGRVDSRGQAADPMTVLDTDCRLRGVARLRVVDASAMPTITSGNTNAPVMLIAEQIARRMLAEMA
ncbi:MAG: GMC family oxidoreductase [Betaproteobacteria bacterium]|nr:GMC family oxidoreductase [Betaproteobacteria bacterium]